MDTKGRSWNVILRSAPHQESRVLTIVALLLPLTFPLLLMMVGVRTVHAQTFEVLYAFTGGQDGYDPGEVAIDKVGNLYGTSRGGHGEGDCVRYGSCGKLFKLYKQKSGWVLASLYDFTGGEDGAVPDALTIGPDGSVYGITRWGGYIESGFGYGTVFRLRASPTPNSSLCCGWEKTVLYAFTGGNDGDATFGSSVPVFDKSGNLYGTTAYGGMFNDGVVYELAGPEGRWSESILYSFALMPDGRSPLGKLIFDSSGKIYGTTLYGGAYGWGSVYQLVPSEGGWTEKVIYSFQARDDGWFPFAGLTIDASGNLYGATLNGGTGEGGVIFMLTPSNDSWTFSVLYSFSSSGLYAGPHASLAMDAAGSLYGTTMPAGCAPLPRQTMEPLSCGSPSDLGTVFKLTPQNGTWHYTLLHRFTGGSDGGSPWFGVVLDAMGNLYGTSFGGSLGYGLVYRIKR